MHRIAHRAIAIATSAVLVAALAACSDDAGPDRGPVPGVTDTEILVGTHMPLTGPASAGYSKIAPATKAYFDHVNASGGVYGRKINYKIMDDGYNPATTQQVVRELVLQDKVFAILNGLGTPPHSGVLDFLNTSKVPDLFVASGSRAWNAPQRYPYTFGFNTDYTVEGKILATYLKSNLAGQKVCFFGQADDFGQDSLVGVEQVLGAGNVAVKQTYVTSNTNVAPQMGELKAGGCQAVVLATVPGFTSLAIGTAARIGFKPTWLVSGVGGDYTTLAAQLGEAKGLLEGMLGVNYLPSAAATDDPWTTLFRKINDERNGGAAFDGNIVYGMSVGYLFVQALLAAGEDLTRQGLVDAIERGGFAGPGLAPLRFSKDNHSGYGGMRMIKVEQGKQDYFGPTYETDSGGGPVNEYPQAPAAPPANGIPTV